MKRTILIWVFSFAAVFSVAQENFFLDSTSYRPQEQINRSTLFDELLMASELEIKQGLPPFLSQPLIPDSKLISKPLSFDRVLMDYPNRIIIDPFIQSFVVTNSTAYRLNDRFSVGGNSYAGKSIFDVSGNHLNDMSIRGASIWFQYKVSNKFRIETRINIDQRDRSFVP